MECVICCESLFHLFHEPMSMGCHCQERLCQRCFKVGGVTKCPMCRKFKKQPRVDRKLLKKEWKQGSTIKCLGCEKDVIVRYLHRHETRCPKFRDKVQAMFEEDLRMRRVQTEKNEKAMADMEARLDLQADTIEELEDQVEELERLSRHQEEERQLFVVEHGRLLRTLEGFVSPMFTNIRSLEALYSRMNQAACSMRASRAHHQVLRRQHHQHQHQHHGVDGPATPPPPPPPPLPPLPPPVVLGPAGGGALPLRFPSPRLMIPPPRPRVLVEGDEEGEVVEVEMEADDDDDDDATICSSSDEER